MTWLLILAIARSTWLPEQNKYKNLKTNELSDYKRLQTTTVDYKRLINSLVLTEFAPLQGETIKTRKNGNTKEQDR